MDEQYKAAYYRMKDLDFSANEMDFIFADWPNWDEHLDWLMTATREEIQDWIEAG